MLFVCHPKILHKLWALSIYEKKTEISVGAKVEFPIGKKLFHLVVNPGTSRCPAVDLELVQTTRNVNGTRHSVRKFQPGKQAHLFRFSFFFLGIFQWAELTKRVPFTAEPEITEILTKWKAPIVFSFSWGHFNSQEKLKTMLRQNFGTTNKEHYGML